MTSEKYGPEQLYVNISFKCKKEKTVKYSDKSSKTRFLIKNNEKNIYLSEIANDKGIFDNILVPNELLSPIFSILFFNINRILTNVISINVKRFIDNSKKKRNNEFIQVPLLNKENSIITILNNSKLETKYSLFEFIKAGIRLNTFVAIDLSKKSLAQDIKKIIDNLGTILSYYAPTKSKVPVFKVYGFGAKIKNNEFTNKEFFNLNLEQNPDISDFTHIIKKYKEFYNNNVNNIEYNNINNFCPLIKEVSNEINLKYEPLEYNIFFIITSNIPKDIKEIIDSLISGSYLPFSVVIIGIGDKNFEEIKNVDNLPANSSRGIDRFRNNAQFVFINKNEDNLYKLYLRKLAKQIVEYYYLNNSNPEKVKKNNIQDIKESFNKYQSFVNFQWSTVNSINNSFNIYSSKNEDDEKDKSQKKSIKNVTILPYGLDTVEEESKDEENNKIYDNTPSGSTIRISSNPYSTEESNCDIDMFTMKHSIKIDEKNKIEKFINTPYYANSILNTSIKTNEDLKEEKFINTPF